MDFFRFFRCLPNWQWDELALERCQRERAQLAAQQRRQHRAELQALKSRYGLPMPSAAPQKPKSPTQV